MNKKKLIIMIAATLVAILAVSLVLFNIKSSDPPGTSVTEAKEIYDKDDVKTAEKKEKTTEVKSANKKADSKKDEKNPVKDKKKDNSKTVSKDEKKTDKKDAPKSSDQKKEDTAKQDDSSKSSGASESSSENSYSEPASSSSETASTHTHSWEPIYESRYVVDQAAWDEEVSEAREESYEVIVCECGAEFSSYDNFRAHYTSYDDTPDEDYHSSDSVETRYNTVWDTKTIHNDEVGHYEDVIVGYRCSSCGETK